MLNIRLFTLSPWFILSCWLIYVFFLNYSISMSDFDLSAFLQECVKRRSLASVQQNPFCSEAAAKDAIEAVWDICYNDTRPFDRAP
jgi:hypothetical protein